MPNDNEPRSQLPDPYGHGFVRAENPVERTQAKWERQEALRLRAGTFARHPALITLRAVFGLSIAFVAFLSVLYPEQALPHPGYTLLIWGAPLLLATVPPLLAGEALWQSIQARISLRETDENIAGGRQSLRSQPGMDRILEGIRDVRRHHTVNALLGVSALFLLSLSTVIRIETTVWNLSFLLAMTMGLAHLFHSLFTIDAVVQQGDAMPCLVHHAPTHHPTQLGSILGELIVLHRDPDLVLDWSSWLASFHDSLLPGYDQNQSWERVLYILLLNANGDMSDKDAVRELREFIRPDALEAVLLDPEAKFNWRSLQRLLDHARVWQPGAFQLLDRLQLDLLRGDSKLLRSPWRMDAALDAECPEGSGHLFIVLNNQTFDPASARIEVLCPGGDPFSRDHRFELQPCPSPREAVSLNAHGEDDALDWVPRYLQQGVVLWLGVAWPDKTQGDRFVQVILRDEAGVVIESQVLRTYVKRRVGNSTRRRFWALERARVWAQFPLPEP